MSGKGLPKLVGWTREQWSRIVAIHGGLDGVRTFLQGSPCNGPPLGFRDSTGGLGFARTIVSWLHYEGSLPSNTPATEVCKGLGQEASAETSRRGRRGGGNGTQSRGDA